MTNEKEIGAGQLFGLLLVSRLSVALTFPFDRVGSFNNCEWVASIIFFPFLLLLLIPSYILYKKTGRSPLLSAFEHSPLTGKIFSAVFCLFFLLGTAVSLSRFNIFMTSTSGADQSPLFFPLLLIIPSFYAAYKGIEAISRTACIVLAAGFISIAIIILAVLPQMDMLNISSTRFYKKDEIIDLIEVFISNTSEAVAYSLLLPRVRGKIGGASVLLAAACSVGMFVIFFSVNAVFGQLTAAENFPFYALADIAELGQLKRLSALHASAWILGLFIKCALFLRLACDCAERIFKSRKLFPLCLAGGILTFAAGVILSGNLPVSKSLVFSRITLIAVVLLAVVFPLIFTLLSKNTADSLQKGESV